MSQQQRISASAEVYNVKLGSEIVIDRIAQACRASGLYVDECLTRANFPLEHLKSHAEENVVVEIIDPGCSFSKEEGLMYLQAAGLARPTDEHALRFAEQYGRTTAGKKPLVIFLHEPWRDPENRYRYVVCIRRPPRSRLLGLYCTEVKFHDECVLAGVRLLSVIIDTDCNPWISDLWTLDDDKAEHQGMGRVVLEKRPDGKLYANGVEIVRYRSPRQEIGQWIDRDELLGELGNRLVLNACFSDVLRGNPRLMPEAWKTGYTHFLGTVFVEPADGYPPALLTWRVSWDRDQWTWDNCSQEHRFNVDDWAASLER